MTPITSVIQYEGDNSTFVWKHPCENFNTSSQLIVHESQEAILFLNGQALDLFGPGRHTLETENIPILRRFVNLPTGGVSAFHCEVYFINKTEQMAIRWGTDSKVQYIDPTYHSRSLSAQAAKCLFAWTIPERFSLNSSARSTYWIARR